MYSSKGWDANSEDVLRWLVSSQYRHRKFYFPKKIRIIRLWQDHHRILRSSKSIQHREENYEKIDFDVRAGGYTITQPYVIQINFLSKKSIFSHKVRIPFWMALSISPYVLPIHLTRSRFHPRIATQATAYGHELIGKIMRILYAVKIYRASRERRKGGLMKRKVRGRKTAVHR